MWAMATYAVWQLFWQHIEDKDKLLDLVMAPILAAWLCIVLLMDFYDKKNCLQPSVWSILHYIEQT